MKNIVWLTEWLPTPVHPYAGDGIERRAKAVSLYNNVTIIYVKKKPGLAKKQVQLEERTYNQNCRAIIYYYPPTGKKDSFIDKLVSNYYFIRLHYKALRNVNRKMGKPAGIQVNVSMKNGVIALLCKWLWKVQYIVVEGWSLFLPEAADSFKKKTWLFRVLCQSVFKRALVTVTVSEHLGNMIAQHVARVPYIVIPSVVDTSIFFPASKSSVREIFRFIHVSSLDHPKNFEQILEATKLVIEKGHIIELVVHGPQCKAIEQLSIDLGLAGIVSFRDELPQPMLASAMRNADVLILYSRYETFGNVIIEANACGLPVIVSDYPTFKEIVIEGKTGLTAEANCPAALAEKMIYIKENSAQFDHLTIANLTKDKYRFDAVALRFNEVYEKFF